MSCNSPTIPQKSVPDYIISGAYVYNAGGGSDGSGQMCPSGPGGNPWGGQSTTSSGTVVMNLNGGLVVVNSANGDHDAFDSNGNININGGYYCANGQEPLDCGDSGSSLIYSPVAWPIAFLIAGATGHAGGSPSPLVPYALVGS